MAARNLAVQWTACGPRVIAAALAQDPDAGILWLDRLMAAHSWLGHAGGGAFVEALGNFASMAGDYELAVQMHGFAHDQLRRLGSQVPTNRPVRNMVWPVEIETRELRERARSAVGQDRFHTLWDEGRSLTYQQIARSRGALPTG